MKPIVGPDISKVIAVARREFIARATTRIFLISTLLLMLMAAIVGLAPVVVRYFDPGSTYVAVYVGASDVQGDPVATLDALLNPRDTGGSRPSPDALFTVRASTDLDADRQRVLDGALDAVLEVQRDARGDLTFIVYTNEPATGSTVVLSRQAATSVAAADRLAHVGLGPAEQASLFVPPQVTVRSPDLSKPAPASDETVQELADYAVVLALEMFLLTAIILYGTWVAQGVVEEKSSRMMEIVLTAASPLQLLAGKVLGVSAVALLQFAAVVVTTVAALFAQGYVASIVLGESAALSMPPGLTAPVLVAFCVFFVLGFLAYAGLFAAAGAIVSRQEDVNQVITPMTILAAAGSMIALYASIGVLDPNAPWFDPLSLVPFLSPYLMLSRLVAGEAGLLEVGIAATLLLAAIAVTIWVAARVYAAGVLMYGQKPSLAGMWLAIRGGG